MLEFPFAGMSSPALTKPSGKACLSSQTSTGGNWRPRVQYLPHVSEALTCRNSELHMDWVHEQQDAYTPEGAQGTAEQLKNL
eukprot:1710869-Amphidinium_carterae.4